MKKVFRWILLVLGVVWVLSGTLGTVVLVATRSVEDGLWRAPLTLLLGIAAIAWSRRLHRTELPRLTNVVAPNGKGVISYHEIRKKDYTRLGALARPIQRLALIGVLAFFGAWLWGLWLFDWRLSRYIDSSTSSPGYYPFRATLFWLGISGTFGCTATAFFYKQTTGRLVTWIRTGNW